MLYLDNAATTQMQPEVVREMVKWTNMGNPSAGYKSAGQVRAHMEKYRQLVGTLCGIDTCCIEDRDALIPVTKCDPRKYKVLFTSGASESNSTIIHSIAFAVQDAPELPHFVVGALEHKGIITQVEDLQKRGFIRYTLVPPRVTGHIHPADVEKCITPATVLVCIQHANNELGSINDIGAIGRVAHSYGVPFHCDAVQMFGKAPLQPMVQCVDSFSVSLHKLGGPPGTGLLCVKQKLLCGWSLSPLVYGTQNNGYRGGTENVPGICCSLLAIEINFTRRAEKNALQLYMREQILRGLSSWKLQKYSDYLQQPIQSGLVVFSDLDSGYIPGTLFLAVITHKVEFCNTKLKQSLETHGIIVSVGSACNTASHRASHVLYALQADKYIRRGAIRISIGDFNIINDGLRAKSEIDLDCERFVRVFNKCIKSQLTT